MKTRKINRPVWMGVMALFAMGFGLLTLISGGSVLFNSQARQAAGNSVDFVVWFNFLAGFAYIIAGVGLWRLQGWSVWLSFLIAGATMLVFALFGVYVFSGSAYEIRTVAAMALRTAVWLVISVAAYRTIQLGLAKGI